MFASGKWKLEIERKFLLKAMPDQFVDEIITIDQYYWKNKSNIWERCRTYHSDKTGDRYIHTIKKSVSKGVNMEDEVELTKDEFEKFREVCLSDENSKFITKERHIFKYGDLKWEVDKFDNGYKLIIAEIELPKKSFKLIIPDYISEVLLMEVTGLKQFSNRNLSIDIKNINKFNKYRGYKSSNNGI